MLGLCKTKETLFTTDKKPIYICFWRFYFLRRYLFYSQRLAKKIFQKILLLTIL